jgi:hypothetical protein
LSGRAAAIARYPHFEGFLAACFLLFAAALQQRRLGLAALCFVAGLATREDAGLHYAGVLVLAIALNAWRGVPWRQQRAEIGFALAGLLYAGAALAVQRSLFPGADSFTRVYLGDPPLAHLSARLVAMRLLYLVVARPYIVLPAAAACVWALLARNASIALGYLACLPWLLLQLAARSDLAGTLCSYYAFPFLIALGWPLIGARPDRWTAPGFACLLALTFVPATQLHNPGRLSLPADFFAAPSGAERTASDRAVAAVSAARPLLGRLVVDDSVAALAPNGFAKSEVRLWAGDAPPDTVVFLTDGYDAARLRSDAMRHELRWRYVVPGTQLHVASLRPLSDVPGLQGILAPAPDQ